MKHAYLLFFLLICGLTRPPRVLAQAGKEDYMAAKTAFEQGNLSSSLGYLQRCQAAFGGSNARIESLRCQVLVQQQDWVNAAIAYTNYDRLLPDANRSGEAYTNMLAQKTAIWEGLAAIEKRKKEEKEKELKADLVKAQAETKTQDAAITATVQRVNQTHEAQLYASAMQSKDKALLELYKEQVGRTGKNIGQVETEIDKHNNPTAYLPKAVAANSVPELDYLLSLGGNLQWLNARGESLLHLAIEAEAFAIFRRLVALKADVEQPDASGKTPVIKAITLRKSAFVGLLLDNGASPLTPNKQERYLPYYYAVSWSDERAAGALYKKDIKPDQLIEYRGESVSPLHLVALKTQSQKFADFLLQQGVSVDARSANGRTALMAAVARKDQTFVNFLLNRGAGINAQDSDGLTALHLAVQVPDADMVQYLIERGGASKKAVSKAKKTPLQLAQQANNKSLATTLKNAQPLINLKSRYQIQEQQYLLRREEIAVRAKMHGYRNTKFLCRLKTAGVLTLTAGVGYGLYQLDPEYGYILAAAPVGAGIGLAMNVGEFYEKSSLREEKSKLRDIKEKQRKLGK